MLLLEPEVVEKVWRKFVDIQFTGNHVSAREATHLRYGIGPFSRASRRSQLVQKFEEELFSYGGSIRQINGERYLEFVFEEQATLFILKHSYE